MERKKIIIIGPAHPFRGGIADTNHSLCNAFIKLGHQSEILTFTLQYPSILFPGKNQFTSDPAPHDLKITRKINSLNPFSWWQAAAYINKIKADLVIFRYWIPYMSPALGSIARMIKGNVRLIGMCDNVLPHEKRLGDVSLTKYFTSSMDGFVTLSSHVKKELETFSSKKIQGLFHPINLDLPASIPRENAIKNLGLKSEFKYVLFFGLIRKYKGLDLLLKAFSHELLKDSQIKLIIAGEFYQPKEEYLDLIRTLKIDDRVIIHDHFIPSEELPSYFCAANLLAQTYKTASQSGVSQIAYHFLTPLLVTDIGGLTEMVPHDKVGIITSGDPNLIAQSIDTYFKTNKESSYKKNIELERENYTWASFCTAIISEHLA